MLTRTQQFPFARFPTLSPDVKPNSHVSDCQRGSAEFCTNEDTSPVTLSVFARGRALCFSDAVTAMKKSESSEGSS